MKICTGCNQNLPFLEYTKAKLGKFGLRSKCKTCRAEEAVIYNSINKEKVSARGKRYRSEKAEQISAQRAIHTADNKERLSEYAEKYRKLYSGKSNAKTAKYKAAKIQATPKWLTEEQLKQIELFYVQASELSKKTGIPHEVDHIVPLRGKTVKGLHVPWNLRVITRSDNRRKSEKIIIELISN